MYDYTTIVLNRIFMFEVCNLDLHKVFKEHILGVKWDLPVNEMF
jgi:hypothetical protein